MMGQATPMKPMDAGQEKPEQSASLNDKQRPPSAEQSSLPPVKESNGNKDSVNGNTPRHNAAGQVGPVGSTSLLPETPQPNLELPNQTEKSAQRTVRTRSQGKREGGPELPVVSALAADSALPLKRRGRRHKSEEPISQSSDALPSGEPATGKESSGSVEREKRIRRPSSRLFNGKTTVSSPAGSQLTGEGKKSTVKLKSPTTPVITPVVQAGPDLTDETQTTKKRRLSKLPIVRKKKIDSAKAKNTTNDIEASGQKDEQGGNGPSEGERAADKVATPATEETPLTDGSKSNTRVKKRGKPRKFPVQSTVSPEGKQITLFFAGQSETHETQPQELTEVTEEPSSNGRDVGRRITPRKRKGLFGRFKSGSKGVLPPAGTSVSESDDQPLSMLFGRPNSKNSRHSSLPDEAGESQKKTDKETPTSKAEESQKKISKGTPKSKAVVEWNGSSLFIKSSPIWKVLQEMEAFQKFPQNPHFRPLEELKEGCREGLAIGNMVTFANIVDKAFKLKLTDSDTRIGACLETLLELEVHGFDITVIHEHLKKLLLVKEGQGKLTEKKKEVENQIADLTTEKVQIDEEIVKFNKEIQHLEEEIAAAKSRKEEKSLEIDELKVKLASIAELIDGAAALNAEDGGDYYLRASPFL